jgi:hypothetical protein
MSGMFKAWLGHRSFRYTQIPDDASMPGISALFEPNIVPIDFKKPQARVEVPIRTGVRRILSNFFGLTIPQSHDTIKVIKLPSHKDTK